MKIYCFCILICCTSLAWGQTENYLTTGIYLGNIEEGARIISFVRLWPKDHPKALGHDYPTLFQFHNSEFETHLFLGEQLGWNLYATLYRHPSKPGNEWHFEGYTPVEVERIRKAEIIAKSSQLVPGLKILACLAKQPVAYIIDTRNLNLEERNMIRATSSGLDLEREKFENALKGACNSANNDLIIVYK